MGEGPSLFTAIYLSNEIRARHVAMRHAIGRIQAWEGGHAYAVFQLFVRTQPRQTVVEPTVARSDSLRGCWPVPVDVLCTTINVEAAAR